MALKSIQYRTNGTCCGLMNVIIEDSNNKIYDVEFIGGCPGNLAGIRQLLKGMDIQEVIDKFQGITCGAKKTSCPDQLAKCLIEYRDYSAQKIEK
ncbi:MAG: TIGR03905 family TSCPD domain-containing protein [Candidatus Gastranaerophilales bacterium]|nr:TIGR03905 family TSCPD domain-containing protein [Candidatus Gastranaerophilales bacterium]